MVVEWEGEDGLKEEAFLIEHTNLALAWQTNLSALLVNILIYY